MTDATDDEIEASRAPLLSHLSELRIRLMWTLGALIVAFGICFGFKEQIFIILTNPFVTAMREAHVPGASGHDITMINTDAFGFFMTLMKLTLFAAIILSFPMTAYQAYAFVAPGLYKKERSAALPFLVAAPVMFALGGMFVYFVAMRFALRFALEQQVAVHGADGVTIHVQYLPKVDEYIALETTLILAFGLFFQMPVVLSLLARIGIVTASMLVKTWRYALVGIAAFAALVAPPDPLSMMVMIVPLFGVFGVSILVVWLIQKGGSKGDQSSGSAKASAAE